jgi:hypothetical protein
MIEQARTLADSGSCSPVDISDAILRDGFD